MNNFIVTAQGFVKSISFDKETKTYVIEYTRHIRNAQLYKTKGADITMKKHGIVGFIYNPYKEEPIRNMYEVRKTHRNFYDDNYNDAIQEWEAVKAIMVSDTDAGWLQSRKSKAKDLLTLEEAEAKALELNTAMLKELEAKISKQKINSKTVYTS